MELLPWSEIDLRSLHDLRRACEDGDGVPWATSFDELEHECEEPGFSPATDGVVAVDDGVMIGWARASHAPTDRDTERSFLDGAVHPDHRRRGVGSALVDWLIARGTEQLRWVDDGRPVSLRVALWDERRDAIALWEGSGFAPVRWFEDLVRPMDPLVVPDPEGIEIVAWDRAWDDAVRHVKNEAFRDHWASRADTPEEWASVLSHPNTRVDLSFVALDDDVPVGFTLSAHYPQDEAANGRREGWIDTLGVLRSHRKQGIASALIARSVAVFRDADLTHAALGVDSENPNGAAGLYRSLGFEVVYRTVALDRPIT